MRVPQVPHSWTTWILAVEEGTSKPHLSILQFEQKDGEIQGKYTDDRSFSLSDGAINGDKITFDVAMESGRAHFELSRDGIELQGHAVVVTDARQSHTLKITGVGHRE
jgi:hypothetical protein